MAAMRTAGTGQGLPAHANIREDEDEYVVQLDVSDFTEAELTVEALGSRLTVRGDRREAPGDEERPLRLHERLEESFRLPDDVDLEQVQVHFRHGTLEIHAPRVRLEARLLAIEPAPFAADADAEPC